MVILVGPIWKEDTGGYKGCRKGHEILFDTPGADAGLDGVPSLY